MMTIVRHARRTPALLALGAALSTGCHTFATTKQKIVDTARSTLNTSYDDPKAEAKMAAAKAQYDAGNYDAARGTFHELAGNTLNPTILAEEARFREAECYRFTKRYPDAVETYHKMMVDHPSGAYREQAIAEMFKIADYWLDDTRAEIQAKQAGQNTTLMALKRQFDIDRTKPVTDVEGRALQALENISTDGIGAAGVDKALFWCGYVNFYRGNYEEADHHFSMLHQSHPDSPLRPLATELAIMCKNNATGGSPYDGQKAAEALQMVHHAEATMPEFRGEDKSEFLTRQKIAIRAQQADKDYKVAAYYEQTGHPGSAYFYYELVRRRYPGTNYAELAEARMVDLKKKVDSGELQPAPRTAFEGIKRDWAKITGQKPATISEDEPKEIAPRPAGVPVVPYKP